MGGYQNRNQYEWPTRFMGVLYFQFLPRTTLLFRASLDPEILFFASRAKLIMRVAAQTIVQ